MFDSTKQVDFPCVYLCEKALQYDRNKLQLHLHIKVTTDACQHQKTRDKTLMWVKQCHQPSPKSQSIGGINHSQTGGLWHCLTMFYPHQQSHNSFLPSYTVYNRCKRSAPCISIYPDPLGRLITWVLPASSPSCILACRTSLSEALGAWKFHNILWEKT